MAKAFFHGIQTKITAMARHLLYNNTNSGLASTNVQDAIEEVNDKIVTTNATTTSAGLMSSADKTKLDGIATGANKITLSSSGSGNAVTALSLSGSAITATKGSTFAASTHNHGKDFSYIAKQQTTTFTNVNGITVAAGGYQWAKPAETVRGGLFDISTGGSITPVFTGSKVIMMDFYTPVFPKQASGSTSGAIKIQIYRRNPSDETPTWTAWEYIWGHGYNVSQMIRTHICSTLKFSSAYQYAFRIDNTSNKAITLSANNLWVRMVCISG